MQVYKKIWYIPRFYFTSNGLYPIYILVSLFETLFDISILSAEPWIDTFALWPLFWDLGPEWSEWAEIFDVMFVLRVFLAFELLEDSALLLPEIVSFASLNIFLLQLKAMNMNAPWRPFKMIYRYHVTSDSTKAARNANVQVRPMMMANFMYRKYLIFSERFIAFLEASWDCLMYEAVNENIQMFIIMIMAIGTMKSNINAFLWLIQHNPFP